MSVVKTKSLDYASMKIVQAFPRSTTRARSSRDEHMHIVWNSRDMNTPCGLMPAEILKHMPITEFGRAGSGYDWCEVCVSRLAAREKREGL
jgi:hypothetical protein